MYALVVLAIKCSLYEISHMWKMDLHGFLRVPLFNGIVLAEGRIIGKSPDEQYIQTL